MAQDAATQRGGSAARPRPHGGPEDRAGSMRAARSERGQSEAGRAWRCGGCRLGGDGAIWGLSRGKKQLWVNFVGTTDKDRRDDFRGIYGKIRPCSGDGLICRSLIRGNPERPGGGGTETSIGRGSARRSALGCQGARTESRIENAAPQAQQWYGDFSFLLFLGSFDCSPSPSPTHTHRLTHAHTYRYTHTDTTHTHTDPLSSLDGPTRANAPHGHTHTHLTKAHPLKHGPTEGSRGAQSCGLARARLSAP